MLKILITGCRGGIGLESAVKLLKKGHYVYVTVHREDSVNEVRHKLNEFGENSLVMKLDITDSTDREKILDWDIDVLVNNAGIGESGPLMEIDVNRIRDVFETNVISAIELTQLAVKKMIENKKGRIVILSSYFGMLPTPFLSPYGISKFALENIGYSLRSELKPFNIPVILIRPGAYNTGFNEKNINKKYQWLNKNGLYKDHMDVIKKSEKQLTGFEIKNLNGISNCVVKAVTSKSPRRSYSAPFWMKLVYPVAKRIT